MTGKQKLGELAILDRMAKALTETYCIKEVKSLRDKAEAARKYAQNAALGLKMQNRAAELKLRAERRAGELLADLITHGGNRRSSSHDESLKLADLGIDHNQSARWRREASVPEAVFEQYIAAANKLGEDITAQGLLRLERRVAAQRRNPKPPVDPSGDTQVNDHDLNGDFCQAKRKYAVTVSTFGVHASANPTLDALAELRGHRNLLHGILEPFCRGDGAALNLHEKRLTLRLLAEIRVLVDLLEQASTDREI